jgi:hypothetical protein
MTVLTEGQHKGEFLVSEAPGTLSRESGTVASGQVLVDGQVVKLSSGKLIAATGANSGGVGSETLEGIVLGNVDASGGDVKLVPYIARLAEVKDAALTKYSGSADANKTTAINALLKAMFIIRR